MKFKKLWPLIGAMCLGLISPAFAHDNYQNNGSTGSGTYGSNANTSSQSSQGTYQRGTFREITPNAGPRVAHGADVFITADFIWWKATQDGLGYAASGFANETTAPLPADAFVVQASTGRNATVGEDWAPGFKVGLGLNLGHDGWDLYTQYTWLHASDSNSISAPSVVMNTVGIAQSEFRPFVTGNRATSNWDLHFNVIDLELGRNFYLSQFLTMRPFIGLKGTWQDHNWKSHFYGDEFELSVDDQNNNNRLGVTGPYHVHETQDAWAIGVRGGFNISWYLSKSWSIYGDMAVSGMMTSYYDVKRRDTIDDSSTGYSKVVRNLDENNFYSVNYVGELELGLRWEMWFYDDNYHFAIQAGWEEQVWLSWLRTPELVDESTHDLSFHGLNLKFRFDF